MNTPSTEIQKVEAWLGSNWYAFGIGAACGIGATIVAHLLKLL